MVEGTRPTTPGQLADRLHSEAQRRGAARERALEIKKSTELEGYTFRPEVRPSRADPQLGDRVPIEKRYKSVQQLRQERLLLRRKEAEAEARKEATFTPSLNPQSLKILERRRVHDTVSNLPVEDRLLRAQEVSTRGEALRMEDDAVPLTRDERHRRIRRFMARQEQFANARLTRAEMKGQAPPDAECTFRPSVNPVSEALTSGESPRSRAHRIECSDARRRQKKQEWLQSRGPPDCTFQPELNPKSRELNAAKGHTENRRVYERLYEDAAKMRSERSDRSTEAEQEDCSTSERQGDTYSHVKSHYNFSKPSQLMADITREQQRRRQRVEEQRQQMQHDELKECTFTPRTAAASGGPSLRRSDFQSTSTMSSCSAIPAGPVLISGYDRFMENRRMAEEARCKDRQKKEASTMRTDSQPKDWVPTLTVPQPFQFSSSRRGSRRTPKEDGYSFRPATNESRRRDALRSALGEEEFSRFMAELDDDSGGLW
ncbi:hypothetical protein FOZ62_027789 [Perkinsus olseni]|uniref:Uncharacterized protein n=2 Tax=Perkinsus olseni TaxID=32597 RepID=A0A7J6NLC5_PEROL|nr:hypothetical protein FOZ62_027789 [Perkinsus olseni]